VTEIAMLNRVSGVDSVIRRLPPFQSVPGVIGKRSVIPAKAGIQGMGQLVSVGSFTITDWIPAFAGMTISTRRAAVETSHV
jgi:hypothetical protein